MIKVTFVILNNQFVQNILYLTSLPKRDKSFFFFNELAFLKIMCETQFDFMKLLKE